MTVTSDLPALASSSRAHAAAVSPSENPKDAKRSAVPGAMIRQPQLVRLLYDGSSVHRCVLITGERHPAS